MMPSNTCEAFLFKGFWSSLLFALVSTGCSMDLLEGYICSGIYLGEVKVGYCREGGLDLGIGSGVVTAELKAGESSSSDVALLESGVKNGR